MAILVKSPERIKAICEDIAKHFTESVNPNGFKGMVVTYDQESCLLYKEAWQNPSRRHHDRYRYLKVIGQRWKYNPFYRDRDSEEKLLERYRDPNDSFKLIIVTAKLLTGFDAPILQAMYLDKPLRNHTLLQAITRANRTYSHNGLKKTHGLIVDYLGVFDDVAKSLEFDEDVMGWSLIYPNSKTNSVQRYNNALPISEHRPKPIGLWSLMAAQECLPTNEVRDNLLRISAYLCGFGKHSLPTLFSPPLKTITDGSQVYESVQPQV